MQLIVFGVEQMNPGIDAMEAADLFLQRDELISFLGIAGNGDAADGKFDAQLRFDRGCDDGVIAEDLFGLVRIGGFAAHADAGVSIVRELGTAETERIGRFPEERGYGKSMNVGLSESKHQSVFRERFLDAEEFEVVAVDGGDFLRSIFESEGKDRDFGAFDILRKVGIRAFGSDAAFFAGDNLRGILDPVEDAVMHLLQDIIGSDRSAGIVEVTTAAVTGGRRKQSSIGGLDTIAQEAEFLDQRNEGMKDILVTALAEAGAEVGEGGAAEDEIITKPGKGPIGLTQPGIAQDEAEVFDIGDLVEIAGQVKDKERDGIVARGAEDGIGVGGDGADEGEIDEGGDQLREAAADGAIVVDMDKLGMELIAGEPAGFLLGKRFGVSPVDSGIDFLEVCDYIVNRELGEINHLKAPRAFGETLRLSKILSGSLFLFPCQVLHSAPATDSFSICSAASSSSRSMKIGDSAVRSCSRA